jgi:lipid A ethanolaminephosphotransferase
MQFQSPIAFAVVVSILLLVFHNFRFWNNTITALWDGSIGDTLFIGSLFLVLLFIHSTFLLLIPGKRLLRVIVSALFLIAAITSYSADAYGVFIDKDMVRNLFETDRREATALLNVRFALYVALLGVLPAVLTWRVKFTRVGLRRQLLHRLAFLGAGLPLTILLIMGFSAHFSVFLREHKSLRYQLSPAAALQGGIQYARAIMRNPQADRLADQDGVPVRLAKPAGSKPLLMFLVAGETARAKNFQLGGYERATNPELAKLDGLYYFNNVTSCGTSTAISLPCMFSHMGRQGFDVAAARNTTNLLDALAKSGINVEWHDNNSGSKGVSARVKNIEYDHQRDPNLCTEESCYDEIMLRGLEQTLAGPGLKDDAVIAFHQIGSHGPSYSKRYPREFERFTPVCLTNELKQCSDEQIRNAYDNSILYTDHNLAQQVRLLQSLSDRFDTLLIYVSDHGESLGEKGLYLHGAPYMFAPDEQKKVPFILWMSDGYRQRFGIDGDCIRASLGSPFSHDNLYHTVLGAMGVKNDIYANDMDILAACRGAATGAEHAGNTRSPE